MNDQTLQKAFTALRDPNKNVRLEAIRELGDSGDPRAIDPLLAPLKDSDEELGMAAAEALARIGAPAVEPLISTMRLKTITIHHPAREVAGGLLSELLGGSFFIGAGGEKELVNVIPRTVHGLGLIGAPAVEPLLGVLRDKNKDVRSYAALALGETHDPRAIAPLIAALRDEHDVRMAAASGLGKVGPPAVEPIILALRDKDALVRWSAADALGLTGDSRAVEPLISALRDKDQYVRRAAAQALGKIGDSFAIPHLRAALSDEDEQVRTAAKEALQKMGEKAEI